MTQSLTSSTSVYSDTQDYVTVYVGDQLFGIPVLQVHDVLRPAKLTRVPLAPPEILGILNLRGRIVTAVDMRARLNLPALETAGMSVVVEHRGELYSLRVDSVGDVIGCPVADFQPPLLTMDAGWLHAAEGVYRLTGELMVVLNIARLLDFADGSDA